MRSATKAPRWCPRAASARCSRQARWPRPPACSATATRSRPRSCAASARAHARLPDRQHGAARHQPSCSTASMPFASAAPTAASMTASPASAGARPSTTTVRRCSRPIVFGFSGDLYGEPATVSLFGFLRGEQKFDGLDALVAQMRARRGRGAGAACRRAAAVGARLQAGVQTLTAAGTPGSRRKELSASTPARRR